MAEGNVSIIISAVDEFSATFKKAGSALQGIGELGTSAVKGITAFGAAAATAGVALTSLAVKGSQYADFQQEFNRLAGEDAPEALMAMKEATLGAVSDIDLLNTSNRLLNQGLSTQSLPLLADFATRLGETTNQFGNVTDIMQSFGSAMATGRTAMLAQMGIQVDENKILQELAFNMGYWTEKGEGNVAMLDEQTKKAAINAAILDEVKKKMQELPKPTADAGSEFDKLRAQFSNLTDEIGAGLAPLGTTVLSTVNSLMTSIQPLIPVITESLGAALVQLTPLLTLIATSFGEIATMVVTQLLPALMPLVPPLTEILNLLISNGIEIIQAFIPALIALVPVVVELVNVLMPLIRLVLPLLVDFLKAVALGIKFVSPLMGLFFELVKMGVEVVEAFGVSIKESLIALFEKLISTLKTAWDWLKKVFDKVGEFGGNALEFVTGGKKMAEGGIVTKPTSAIIGEAGPEAVIPLKDFGKFSNGLTINIENVNGTDPDDLSNALQTKLRGILST